MGNSFRVDRVGMEIKREVNEILQKKVPLKLLLKLCPIVLPVCISVLFG